jgi:hypothetical protein
MTTLLVNINNEQEERVLLAFLDSHKYNYVAGAQPDEILESQKEEIIKRELEFASGHIKAEPWEEVKKRFIK